MYCPKCGKELPEGAQFCPHCGSSVSTSAVPPEAQNASGHDQDIPTTEPQTTPPTSQQPTPSVPNEEIKCPKCGATGCVPQYKQNVSGGGYGCCQGALGSLILGPLGLLCGACGRSVKTTNNLVWICPKCGHEFKKPLTKEEMEKQYRGALWLVRFCGIWAVASAFIAASAINGPYNHKPTESDLVGLLCGIIMVAFCAYGAYWGYSFSERTEYQQQKLKKNIAIVGIITGVSFLLFILFFNILS